MLVVPAYVVRRAFARLYCAIGGSDGLERSSGSGTGRGGPQVTRAYDRGTQLLRDRREAREGLVDGRGRCARFEHVSPQKATVYECGRAVAGDQVLLLVRASARMNGQMLFRRAKACGGWGCQTVRPWEVRWAHDPCWRRSVSR